MEIICLALDLWVLGLFGRVILSFFPIAPGGALASVNSVLHTITEPVVGPVRRILPTVGMLDLSPLVILLAVNLLIRPLLGCGRGFL